MEIFILKGLVDRIKRTIKSEDKFFDASEAYQIAKYNDKLTREQLKEKLIEKLKKRIVSDFKISGQFLDITTYEGYREKLLLPEIAEYFRDLKYHVDLLNDNEYKEVNVLIINWQNLETFK